MTVMKRVLLSLVAFALFAHAVYAIPAKPGFRTYTQPDGKALVLEQKGDEYGSWFRDKSGNLFTLDGDGFFHPVSKACVRRMINDASLRRSRANRLRRQSSSVTDKADGVRRIPVVLIEFSDVRFRINNPVQSFDALLNQYGYNGYGGAGATGSVRDYYLDNSHGAFEPVFDVFGPVLLNNPIKYYGEPVKNSDGSVKKEDKQPELALYDACLKIDDIVDFSRYDYNSDGLVDMILFYYAGGSQAEGWPSDNIWPHSWSIQSSSVSSEVRTHKFDGKKLSDYFCTAELKGNTSDYTMCSIGPTCHELGHSLGLPDFYDTDYQENGENGGLYIFSAMSSGSYNDDSRTPPYFNSEERIMLGWMDESDVKYVEAGDNTLPFIDQNIALRTDASVQGEYFLYEKRGGEGNKWDKPLPEGMVVYHVDKSQSHYVVGGVTAELIWVTNSINNYGTHPCFTVVPAPDQNATNYAPTQNDYSDFVFPGYYRIDTFCAVDWDGNDSGFMLSDIRLSGNEVLFFAKSVTDSKYLEGVVTDTSGKPLEGVTVSLYPYEDAAPRQGIVLRKLLTSGGQQAQTDSNGRFSFETGMDSPEKYTLSAALEGYVGQSVTVQMSKIFNFESFSLRAVGEFGMTGEFSFWDVEKKDLYVLNSSSSTSSVMCAAKCPRSVWGAYEGLLVKEVSFPTYYTAESYYFILETSDGITCAKSPKMEDRSLVSFDISQEEIRMPSDDFYIGFAVENVKSGQDGLMAVSSGVGCYISAFTLSGHGAWSFKKGYDVPLTITLYDQDYAPGLPDIGCPYIDIAPGAFKSGDKVKLKLATSPGDDIKSITWTYDGVKFPDESTVELDSGWHELSAELIYADGSKNVIEREIEVK